MTKMGEGLEKPSRALAIVASFLWSHRIHTWKTVHQAVHFAFRNFKSLTLLNLGMRGVS